MILGLYISSHRPPELTEKSQLTLQYLDSWKDALIQYLINFEHNFEQFLPGGLYDNWLPLSESMKGQRIEKLNVEDQGRVLIFCLH